MNEGLFRLLQELSAEASTVRAGFDDLFDPSLDVVPMPFFGDILRAKVITIGLNPSDGELRGRGWSRPVDAITLYARLTRYFNNGQFMPHPWFSPWEKALEELGVSYANGTAAHIDLCPWPTRPMSCLPDHARFTNLVSQSLPCFWRCIALVENLRLVLMAGAVNKTHYINEFLLRSGPHGDNVLLGKVPRGGTAFVGYHQLRTANKEFPVFFCSVSPSSRTRTRLPLRIREHRGHLMTFL